MKPRENYWSALVAGAGALLGLMSSVRADVVLPVTTAAGSGVTIKLATPLVQMPHFGFMPVRATIENLSASDGAWDVQFQVGNIGAGAPLSLVSRHALAVPAGQTRDTWLYVPVARAGFATNVAGGVVGAPRVAGAKASIGTKVTRAVVSATGRPVMTVVVDINETTGEMTTQNIGPSGAVINTGTNRPPAGSSVAYVVDSTTGVVLPRHYPSTGAFRVDVNVTPSAAGLVGLTALPPAPSRSGLRTTVVKTPNGAKITRTFGSASSSTTEETEFDTKAMTINITRTFPNGTTSVMPRSVPNMPGTEVTYRIDSNSGSYVNSTRTLSGSTAPAKMIVTVGSLGGGGLSAVRGTPAARSTPIPTTIVAQISGLGVNGTERVAFPNGAVANGMRPFATSSTIETDLRAALVAHVTGAPNLATVAPAQLPADWRVWSSFAGVILPATEFAALDAARRNALRGWVGSGGQLFLAPAEASVEATEVIGAGRIVSLADPMASMSKNPDSVFNLYGETNALPDREALFLKDTTLGEELKIEDGDSSWIAIFLVIFAAVIGPVNLFVFAPASRRHRLFWTTPALALLGGVILVTAIFFQDGMGGVGQRQALVILLPGQNQAAVWQEQSASTGFLPSRGFALDDDVIFAPLANEQEQMRFGVTMGMATREGGQAGGDWFRNRAKQAHLLRRLTPTRGRVELAGAAPDGAPIVESSLATVLREFMLRDAAGKLWRAREVGPGRRVTLEPASGEASFDFVKLGGSLALSRAYVAATAPTPGRWAAMGGDTDMAPIATLARMRWSEGKVVYTGVAEPPANPPAKGGRL